MWHWLLIRPIVIQCAYPWRELSIFVNKSYQSFSRMNSWVSPCVKLNQSQPSLMALNVFGTQLLLLGVMILSIRDSWCSYQQDLKTNCSSFQFLLKFAVSGNCSLNWYYGSLVFNFLGSSWFCITEMALLLGYQVFVFLRDEFSRCSFKWWSF